MMVRVWQYKLFDSGTGEYTVAAHYATAEAIARAKGIAILKSDALVDSALIDDEGITPLDFRPAPESG